MARLPSAERRVQLVDAAIRVMTRDGIGKATTRAIVGEAGVSLSVFHYCFDSKQALLEAVVEAIMKRSVPAMARVTDAPTRGTLHEAVRGSLQGYWDHVVANPAEHLLTYELTQHALHTPGLEEVAKRQYREYLKASQLMVDELKREFRVTTVGSPGVLARYLAVMVDGLTLNYLILGDRASAEAVLDTVAAHVVSQVVSGSS
jgi:AcrR family transcriptional regulator